MGQVIDLMRDWRVEDGEFIVDRSGALVVRLPKKTQPQEAELQVSRLHLITSAPALLEALKDAKQVLETAKQYFPKSVRNSDTFSLLNVLANSIKPAIAQAEGE